MTPEALGLVLNSHYLWCTTKLCMLNDNPHSTLTYRCHKNIHACIFAFIFVFYCGHFPVRFPASSSPLNMASAFPLNVACELLNQSRQWHWLTWFQLPTDCTTTMLHLNFVALYPGHVGTWKRLAVHKYWYTIPHEIRASMNSRYQLTFPSFPVACIKSILPLPFCTARLTSRVL